MNSSNALELNWEWPTDRQPDSKIVVRVDTVKKPWGGLFGVGRSPSIASNLPDPIEIHAAVVLHGKGWTAEIVKLTLPKVELAGVKSADRVALGIVQKNTCICAARIPDDLADSKLDAWLNAWVCGK